jgi:nucleolar GTP-binding protein
MGFEKINAVNKYDFYIDMAFKNANKKAKALSIKKAAPSERKKKVELKRITAVKDVLNKQLGLIVKSFPSFDDLTDFYKDLIKVTIGLADMKKSLGAVNWARKKSNELSRKYASRIKASRNMNQMTSYRKEFYGRINSVLKQIKNDFIFLENARKQFRKFPVIKKRFTIALSGFPNVGKSTLLSRLTGAKPEIAGYAFTTRGLMMGTIKKDNKKIQLIDTPGTLNRFNKMNNIEMQAWLALKHVADIIVYIFDLTEPYPLGDQEKLLRNIKNFKKPILIYLSKTDIIDKETINNFFKKHKKAFVNSNKLKQEILKKI